MQGTYEPALTYLDTPIGEFAITGDEDALHGVHLLEMDDILLPPRDNALTREAARQLHAYFQGRLRAFSLPLAPRGTEFQRRVWRTLCEVPFGDLCTYGMLAELSGYPGAARAVGGAVGRNPLMIIVPCHRVVASNGIGGFAFRLDLKRFLLRLEGALPAAWDNPESHP